MRKAGGIMLLVIGLGLTYPFFYGLISVDYSHLEFGLTFHIILYTLFFMVCAFILTGGVFCIRRRHWRVCFGSGWFLILIMLYAMAMFRGTYLMFVSLIGILPVIFVGLSRREWQKSQT